MAGSLCLGGRGIAGHFGGFKEHIKKSAYLYLRLGLPGNRPESAGIARVFPEGLGRGDAEARRKKRTAKSPGRTLGPRAPPLFSLGALASWRFALTSPRLRVSA